MLETTEMLEAVPFLAPKGGGSHGKMYEFYAKTRDSAVSRCFHQKGARNSRKMPSFVLIKNQVCGTVAFDWSANWGGNGFSEAPIFIVSFCTTFANKKQTLLSAVPMRFRNALSHKRANFGARFCAPKFALF